MSQTVVITGAAGPLGRRVAALAAADDAVTRVLAVGPGVLAAEMPPSIETRAVALDDPELKGFLAEADVLVHLGSGEDHGPEGLPSSGSASSDLADTRALLDAAAATGVAHVVTLSSAMVYGAWANNPVPLTEDAPLRPDPGLPYASAKAESERLVFEWRAAQSGPAPKVAVLRPTVAVSGESTEWLSSSPWSAAALRASGTDRPSQFLHLDDLASAIDHARREALDGPFNVAPDGWLPADVLRDLAGPVGRLHLPAGLSGRLATAAGRHGHERPSRGMGLHPPLVGRGQRPPPGHRLAAPPPQRGGLRRGRSGRAAGHDEPPSPPGALAARRSRRHRAGRRRRRLRPPSPSPFTPQLNATAYGVASFSARMAIAT